MPLRMSRKDNPERVPPNELSFSTFRPYASKPHCVRYYWVLKDHSGHHIGSSNNLYPEKIDAVRNAITLFGKEIWDGTHVVVGEQDFNLVREESLRMEKG